MSLLYPEFLWALTLNIFPVIIHLFNLQKHETLYFSDLTLLKNIEKETKKTSTLKNLLLLILRILTISSLVIAFTIPYKKDNLVSNINKDELIGLYIDNSFSMLRSNQDNSLLEAAKDDVMKLISNHSDQTKYILTTNTKSNNKAYPINKNDLINEISSIRSSYNSLSFDEIVAIQQEQSKNNISKSFWFTDLHKKDFNLNKVLTDSTSYINLIHYTSNKTGNISIDSVWFSDKNRKINSEEELNVKITNHTDKEIEFQTKLSVNENEVSSQSLNVISPLKSKTILFHFVINNDGIKNGNLKISDADFNDQLFDDNYFFTYEIDKKYQVLYVYNNELNNYNAFKTLFEDVEKTTFNSLDISKGFTSEELQGDLIILDGLTTFTDKLKNELIKNKNILLIASDKEFQNNDNQILKHFGISLKSKGNQRVNLDQNKIDLNFFKAVFGKQEKNIDLPYFNTFYKSNPDAETLSLLSFENNYPLLIKKKKNTNQLFYFTSSLSTKNTNLTNHALFVPIFLKIKEDCSNDFIKQYEIEKTPFLPLYSYNQQNGQLKVMDDISSPTFSFFPSISNNQGNYYINCENQISKDGHYFVKDTDTIIYSFSTNFSREESNMSFFNKNEFKALLKNSPLKENINYINNSSIESQNILKLKNNNPPYWTYFVLLALIFIALEITLIKLIR